MAKYRASFTHRDRYVPDAPRKQTKTIEAANPLDAEMRLRSMLLKQGRQLHFMLALVEVPKDTRPSTVSVEYAPCTA